MIRDFIDYYNLKVKKWFIRIGVSPHTYTTYNNNKILDQ